MAFVTREDVVKKIFKEIAPNYTERNGGYTRITRTGVRRGDAAETAMIDPQQQTALPLHGICWPTCNPPLPLRQSALKTTVS